MLSLAARIRCDRAAVAVVNNAAGKTIHAMYYMDTILPAKIQCSNAQMGFVVVQNQQPWFFFRRIDEPLKMLKKNKKDLGVLPAGFIATPNDPADTTPLPQQV